VLALNAQGAVSWLQLEPAENLHELAEMAESQAWDASTVQAIRTGEQLVDLELQQALGASHQPQPRQSFIIAGTITRLHAAVVTLGESFGPGLASSYERFLLAHEERLLPQD
jgi:hypothetical protein